MAFNLAISTEHLDDPDSDIELGLLGSSAISLIQGDPATTPTVNRRTSIPSIRSSVRSIRKSFLGGVRRTWTLFKTLLNYMKLFIIVMLYSALGAGIFMWIEIPNNVSAKQEALEYHLIARDTLLFRLRIIHVHDGEDREDRWKEAILDYENSVGLQEPSLDTDWTFWMSFLYAGTIFTTIGYGNIACKTVTGQLVTMFYAILGIPLMLITLNDLGKKLLTFVKKLSDFTGDIILFLGLKLGIYDPDPDKPMRFHLAVISRRAANIGKFSAARVESSEFSSVESVKKKDVDIERNPPVIAAVIFTISWLFLCAAVFRIWEDWTYWTSFYFFFISLTTIGFGDVSPAHPEYMFMTFGVVLIGLALVSVCINVVQEKLDQLYMALLEKLLEDYKKAIERGDQTAAVKGMMGGFQDQAKYLMPLMSKSQGAKVMTHFKEQAKAKGIELPPVLTNLDPETGMPAFASAKEDDFQEFIEKANEQAKPPEVISTEIQTEAEVEAAVKPTELAMSIEVQTDAVVDSVDKSTQYEIRLATVQSQTTDLIRTVNAELQVNVCADTTDSSTQSNQATFVEIATQLDIANTTESSTQVEFVSSEIATQYDINQNEVSTQVELVQVEAAVEAFIDVRPQSFDAETDTELISSSDTFSTDSGIQTWISMEDISTQAVAEFEDCQSQTAFSCFTLQDNFSQHEEEVASVEIQSDFSIYNCTSSDTQTDSLTFLMQSVSTQQNIELKSTESQSTVILADFDSQTEPPQTVEMGIQPELSIIFVPKDEVEQPQSTESSNEQLGRFLRHRSSQTEQETQGKKRPEIERPKDDIIISFSFWNGSGHRREVQMKKSSTIGQFLAKAIEMLRKDFSELKSVSAESLMFVKEDLIIPHFYTFHDGILTKAMGKSGPLLKFDASGEAQEVQGAAKDTAESHPTKVVLQSWYVKNKHLYPSSAWEPFVPNKKYK